MTLAADKRKALADLRRQMADILAPEREERKRRDRERRKALRKVVKESEAENRRDVRETEPAFLAYLRRQPCAARRLGGCDGPIEAAHIRYSDASKGVRNPGMGRKNHDRHANPLCRFHHQSDQHKRRERDFWGRLGVDAYESAAAHYAAYRRDK